MLGVGLRAQRGAAFLPVVTLMGAILCFQIGAVLSKTLFPRVGGEATALLRLGMGAIILAVLRPPWRASVPRRLWPLIVLYGAVLALMNTIFQFAIARIPLGVAIAIEFTGPLLVATLSSRRLTDFAWIGLAAIGILLLSPPVRIAEPLDPLGVALAFAAGACWAAYIPVGQRVGRALGSRATGFGMAVGAIMLLPFGVAHAGWALTDPSVLLIGVGIGILSGALPFTLEMSALTQLSARAYGTLTSLEPAIGALVALIVLGEALPPLRWLGIILVVVAAIGAATKMQRPPPSNALD